MTKLTDDAILQTSAELLRQTGSLKVTLQDVGAALGVSHAALYKHFASKQALWTALALRWLDQALAALFPYRVAAAADTATIAHDWLWTLADAKRQARLRDPAMFAVYTAYIAADTAAYTQHTQALGRSFMAATGKDAAFTTGVLFSFMFFSAPEYAARWDADFQQNFELTWAVVRPAFV
ncbi:TetR/AcrR family transcriptional regulator [Lacticaseibacillus kribbianus]|uniref:TetR/AcrR family transcriptional regulator n=1 Tax=Lacticaseibacillus kribbianus TaxID=2926292 RepID=UPI001CD28EFA|nr:TetR/AcrR family transcriptional regulator [Lacticaseibacillus kribbianus]